MADLRQMGLAGGGASRVRLCSRANQIPNDARLVLTNGVRLQRSPPLQRSLLRAGAAPNRNEDEVNILALA